jgi:exportin-2 (importin alpha re-exporter)
MCTVPPQIQAQVSETISLIAAVDFPDKWDNLLPELVQKLKSSQDLAVINGVLMTANSIFKRFRYVQRCDELYRVILYTLNHIQAPLLKMFIQTGQAVEAYANDPQQLAPRFEALRLMCRIFFSLNFQDLPEFFEDHMKEWMEEFAKYLVYKNPLLVDENEEDSPSPVDKLQSAIIENLKMYADKDEEPFIPFLPNFTSLVWNLLVSLTAYSKHDILVTTSIKFLSSLVEKKMHSDLFKEEATLRQIVSRIVIPNLMVREVDEEKFEDDPQEFILTEIEGSDSESRRKCSRDLLRAMCRQFEAQTTAISSEHVASMLGEFAADNSKWAAKDTAVCIGLVCFVHHCYQL